MQRILVVAVVLLLVDSYAYFGFSNTFTGTSNIIFKIVYWISVFVTVTSLGLTLYYFPVLKGRSTGFTNYITGFMMAFFTAKLLLVIVLLGEDVFRGGKWLLENILSWFQSSRSVNVDSRRKFVGQLALGAASIPFVAMLYGTIKGRYDFKVHKITLKFKDLPSSFDGFKIAQFSDLHSGSFGDKSGILKGLNIMQDQDPDMILFTGDLVNNHAYEIEPYIDLFKQLKAPFGKYSVMGNHDYGDYVTWNSQEEKVSNVKELRGHHTSMGFDLLENESRVIKKDGQSIRLLGVENWGKPPFPQYGDLDKSLSDVNQEEFTVLMSHDPDHWEQKTLKHAKNINLTLAGHTHGMQFGVEIPGFRWSPVQYKYHRWAGLYKELGQYLYVNRGFGYLGYPGRVGIWPEITIIELKQEMG